MINSFTSLQYRAHNWCMQYRPPEERTPEYILMHATEELGEVVKCLRRKQLKRRWGKKAGVPHPEGIGSEIADVVILMAIISEELGLDGAEDIEIKMKSLEDRLDHKLAKEKAKKKRKGNR